LQPSDDQEPHSGPFGHGEPTLPQVFGRYLLVQRLSRGGMGEIFLAKHGLAGFEKLAVIKKVLPHLAADDQFISRFVDEAQVAIKLQHVNVAQVFEVGRVGDEYFLALEYVDGRDLRRTLAVLAHRKQRMPVDLALFITRELANGLAYAHRRTTADGASLDLVHCDISPPNVLVSFEGETKVIDFGIAKSAMRGTATDPSFGFGKFGYMAPEQLIRGGVVDYRTDLYAAGVVLFELLTGTRLYEAGPEPDYRALAAKVARGDHLLPSDIDRTLAAYDDLVATALRPHPEDRFQSAAELRDAIQHSLVAVNPTISTDRLGSYMRALFSDEMALQRELHERVASADLADFQDQFHTQSIATVSFAVAEPAGADATGRVPRRRPGTPTALPRRGTAPTPVLRGRTTGGARALRPSPALDTQAPPTGALEPVDLADALAASRSASRRADPLDRAAVSETARSRRSRRTVIATSCAIALLAGFGVWGFAAGDRGPKPPRAPIDPGDRAPARVIVEPIEVAASRPVGRDPAGADPAGADPAGADPAGADPARPAPVAPAPRDRPSQVPLVARPTPPTSAHDSAHRPIRKDARPLAAPAPLTREQLGQKFQQVRREYDDYKASYGARLEREWGELATFIQYDDDAEHREAARRLEAFRARMRE
jgi:serine/threonine protein kinase